MGLRKLIVIIAILWTLTCGASLRSARAQSPSWLSSAVIYCVNPEIFSTGGLSGVTSQLTRIHNLGCNVVWLMPIYPRGQACTIDGISHPTYNSPYDINNLEAIDPNVGTSAQFTTLISTAHGLGMKVILDMPLNCTSWDNPLVTSTPQYYWHSDGNATNVASIEAGWQAYGQNPPDNDVAELNLTTNTYGAQTYVISVVQYWLANYALDGFRFDAADDPDGANNSLPQSLMESLNSTVNPSGNLLMLGEEQYEPLALAPYDLDYGWNMYYYGIGSAFTTANDASTLQYQWTYPYTTSYTKPAAMLEMNIQDDWDMVNRDNIVLGGYAQAMAAAVWDFTITGVPLMYNGMEVANTNGGDNSHTQIDWTGTDSAAFTTFYTQLLALRNGSGGALQQGTMTFETCSSSAVTAYDRTGGGNEYFIEINTNGSTASGTVSSPSGATWTEVTPAGAPGGTSHELPSTGSFSLQAYDFAIFKRTTGTAPSAPTGLTPTAGNTQVALSWTASTGATSYNVYRGTTSGGEGSTPVASNITSTSYTDTGLTNGTKYYYEVAAVNASGTSGMSNEVSSTPAGASGGTLSGALTTVSSATTYNLTSEGTSDWGAWGFDSFDHDSGGGSKIGNASVYGGGSMNSFTSSFLGFTWTNGTPDSSETGETDGYYNNGGVGDGFQFTVPAGTSTQTLIVYVGGWSTGGTLTATLSDGSATAYTNSGLSNSSNSYYGYYTINYAAASASQTLTVVWKEASGTGNVTLYAAALQGGSTPTAATPTFSPAAGTYAGAQSITLSDSTSGSTIYYTTNGTTPTTSSTKYTGAISVSTTETVEAIATASGYNNSSVASSTYTITAPSAPTGLTATAGNAQVALSWSASSGATSYNVYRGTTSGGEGSTAIANVTTTAYTNTGLTNGTTYYYKVAAVDAAGTGSQSSEQSAEPTGGTSGSLSGTPTTVTSATTFNLTSQGTTDWAAWGFDGMDRDSSGGSKIGSASAYGGGSMNSFNSSYLGFTWTNGTPDTSETGETDGCYNNGGVGDGFQFTVPASTTVQHVTVYVGGWSSGGTLTATLSDGSAATYTNSSMSNSGNSYYGYYTLTYNAASASQTLTIVWKEASGSGNVTLYAATLH